MTSSPKPQASISLNLDNKWSYLKIHGDPAWRWFPTYFSVLVPRVLAFLRERNLRITMFLTGQDAAMPEHLELIRAIAADGHEIANYSFHNEPWLASHPPAHLQSEIAHAEEQIAEASGYHPVGFRAPGFSISHDMLQTIAQRGYLYDSSTLPTYFATAARAYRLKGVKLAPEYREQRENLAWGWRDARRPLDAYLWQLAENELLEIPVTTTPGIRTPLHVSYLLSLSRVPHAPVLSYLRLGMSLCSASGLEPSILLNPFDFISADTAPELAFLPSMKMPIHKKLEFTGQIVDVCRAKYKFVTLREQAIELSKRSDLAHIEPQYLWK